ncbi:hypothetical protein ACPXB3_08265 [Gordonia sp. DT219]
MNSLLASMSGIRSRIATGSVLPEMARAARLRKVSYDQHFDATYDSAA